MGRVANRTFVGLVVAGGMALTATLAQATTFYNLTGLAGVNPSTGTNLDALIAGGVPGNEIAKFSSGVDETVVGTGVLDPFVRIQQTGNGNCPASDICIESGYNTDSKNEQFETKDNGGTNWNHSLTVGQLGKVCFGANNTDCYYQFVLDINEANSSQGDQFLSLDKFQIYLSDNKALDTFTEVAPDCNYPSTTCGPEGFGAAATKIYDIDKNGDSSIALNYDLNSGSGKGIDMYAYIPVDLFGNDLDQFVYLYSSFGATGVIKNGQLDSRSGNATPPNGPIPAGLLPDGNYAQSAGFEEWSTMRRIGTPEPMSLCLFLIGLAALGFTQRKRLLPARAAA